MGKDYLYLIYYQEKYYCLIQHIKENNIELALTCSVNKHNLFILKIIDKLMNKDYDYTDIILLSCVKDKFEAFKYLYNKLNSIDEKYNLIEKFCCFVYIPFKYFKYIIQDINNIEDLNKYGIIVLSHYLFKFDKYYIHFDVNMALIVALSFNYNIEFIKNLISKGANNFYLICYLSIATGKNDLFKLAIDNAELEYKKQYIIEEIEFDNIFGLPIPNDKYKKINVYKILDNQNLTNEMRNYLRKKIPIYRRVLNQLC